MMMIIAADFILYILPSECRYIDETLQKCTKKYQYEPKNKKKN